MTAPRPGPTRSAGFSLIEMLVALVVLGLAGWVLAAGIGRVGLGLDLARQSDQRVDGIANAQFLIRQRMAAMQPGDTRGLDLIDFAGLGQSVDFVADAPLSGAPDALHYYRVARDPDGDLVLFSLNSLDPRVDSHSRATVGWTAQPLVHATLGVEMRYFGPSPNAPMRGPVWQENWTHRGRLPALVRIRVSFPEGDPRVWPELVIHPLAATATGTT